MGLIFHAGQRAGLGAKNNSLGVRYASLKHVLAVSPETALVRLLAD